MSHSQLTSHLSRLPHPGRGASLLLTVLAFTLLTLLAPSPAAAQQANVGQVVVQFDDHAQAVRSFSFSGEISGLEALELSGLEVVTTSTSFGPAVCSIAGVGCPATDCFCDSLRYWSYTYWDGAAWQSYPVGAGSSVITRTGAVEGWRWGEFGADQRSAAPALAADQAIAWLDAQPTGAAARAQSVGSALETLFALTANRQAPAAVLAESIRFGAFPYSLSGPAAAGKLAAGYPAAAACLNSAVWTPDAYLDPVSGRYGAQPSDQAWAILGALSLGQPVPTAAVDGLAAQATSEGGWEWSLGWGADTNTTALALQALIAAGEPVTATVVTRALAYLASAQNPDGGFAYVPGPAAASDANSTAYVLQALVAADEDPSSPPWTTTVGSPLDYLLSLQLPDGSLAWQAGGPSNLLATQQAIPALLGRAHPLSRAGLQVCPGVRIPQLARPITAAP